MTTDEKRRAYYATPSGARKERMELTAFIGFIKAANLEADFNSITNCIPPLPDMSCLINGERYFFELGEIIDENLAQDVRTSSRAGVDSSGGFFSEAKPLIRLLHKKAGSTYRTDGAPLDLVLHYDLQAPYDPASLLRDRESDVAAALSPNGPFSRIWVYDSWTKTILWPSS